MTAVINSQALFEVTLILIHLSFLSNMYNYPDTLALIAQAEGISEDEVDEYTIEDIKIADEELKKRLISSFGGVAAVLLIGVLSSAITNCRRLVVTYSILIAIVALGGLSKLPTYSSGWLETTLLITSSMSGFHYAYFINQCSRSKCGLI